MALRAGGFIYLKRQAFANRYSKNNTYKIVCLGESTTAGGWSPKESYPVQLEEILNKSYPLIKFKVINKGIPGTGSGYIADNFVDWIDEYKPHAVSIMMGINDCNYNIPLDEWTRKNSSTLRFLKESRIYKLLNWMKLSFKEKLEKNLSIKTETKINTTDDSKQKILNIIAASQALKNKDFSKAEKIYLSLLNKDNKTRNFALKQLIDLYYALGLKDRMFYMLKEKLDFPYDDYAAKKILHFCEKKQFVKDVFILLMGFISDREDNFAYYNLLGDCMNALGYTENAQKIFSQAKWKENAINVHTRENYLKIIKILKGRNIKIFAVQYPLRSAEELKKLLSPYTERDCLCG